MTGPNGQLTPGPGARIIPLLPGVARPSGGRREQLREAVIQVVSHLVIEKVPDDRRSPLFDQAAELLDEAGWGLDELYAAASDGPERSALLRALGLETKGPAPGAPPRPPRPGPPPPGPRRGPDLEASMTDQRRSVRWSSRAPPGAAGPRAPRGPLAHPPRRPCPSRPELRGATRS